jgi:hypothetical protein
MYPPQLSHPHWLTDAPKMISSLESDKKQVNRCTLPSSQLVRKGIIWLGQVESLSLLRSYALTLNKCALAATTYVIVAKDCWKICMISLVTRVCLSTPKSTSWCIPPGIHKVTNYLEPMFSPQSSSVKS